MSLFLRHRELVAGLGFIFVAAAIAHLAFSWMGFVPSDDGFILAISRRLVEGQIPHLDFIWVRPVGSPLLFSPILFLSGDYVYWVARFFVWVEFATMAWLWTLILTRLLNVHMRVTTRMMLALLALILSVHNILITPWYTTDGLFFATIGIWLSLFPRSHTRLLGYVLAGFAALCKQNFLLIAPLCILFSPDRRKISAWLCAFLPVIAYCTWILMAGGLHDFIQQLSAHTDIVTYGFVTWIKSYALGGSLVLGYGIGKLLNTHNRTLHIAAWLCIDAIIAAELLLLGIFVGAGYFALMGVAIGCAAARMTKDENRWSTFRALALVSLVGWSASISIGYNTPALMGGAFSTLLFVSAWPKKEERQSSSLRWNILALLLLAISCFIWTRLHRTFREAPARELTVKLEGLLPGGAMLYGNPRTAALFKDLKAAQRKVRGKTYAIIPDLAGYWPANDQINPLLSDWNFRIELPTVALQQRAIDDVNSQRGNLAIITQKMLPDVANGFRPFAENALDQPIRNAVRATWKKTGETNYFEIYE